MLITRCTSFQASYGVEDPEYAVTQLAQTTMRSELGKLTLDKVFRVRLKIVFQSEFVFIYLITLLFYIFLSSGKRDPKYQHSPLHKPGIR